MNDQTMNYHDLEHALTPPSVACVTDRGVSEGYWKRFRCYEMSHSDLRAKPSALRKWRESAPEGAEFIARLDPQVALDLFTGERAEELIKHGSLRCEALQASALLLHTPASFRPSREHIEALRGFMQRFERPCPVAWRADGLWEESDTYLELCAELDLIPVIDPLMWEEDEALPQGERFYWRVLGGQGLTPRVNDFDLDRLLDLCEQAEAEGWVVFSSPRMEREAKRFRAMIGDE